MTNSISPIAAVKLLREALEKIRDYKSTSAALPAEIYATAYHALRLTASIEQPASYTEGWLAGMEEAAREADHWQKISRTSHKCGECISGVIRTFMLTPPTGPANSDAPPAEPSGAPVDERADIINAALYIALDLANAEAADVHQRYKGYKPHAHIAVDADVETVKAAILALQQPGLADNTPKGWKLVPVEPTDAMAEAGMEHTADPCWKENVKAAYRAMLSAATSP